MNKALQISTRLLNCKSASRVCQTASTRVRNWSSKDERKNVINITRIYNDKDGHSHFSTIEVELKGSGEDIHDLNL